MLGAHGVALVLDMMALHEEHRSALWLDVLSIGYLAPRHMPIFQGWFYPVEVYLSILLLSIFPVRSFADDDVQVWAAH